MAGQWVGLGWSDRLDVAARACSTSLATRMTTTCVQSLVARKDFRHKNVCPR